MNLIYYRVLHHPGLDPIIPPALFQLIEILICVINFFQTDNFVPKALTSLTH